MSASLRPHGLQHARLPCPSVSPRVCSDSCPLSWWCHPTISILCHPLLPAIVANTSLFQWVGSSHQVAKVLELQLQHQSFQWIFQADILWDWPVWSPWYPRDSLESSPELIWKHQFFSTQSPLWSNSHSHTWLLEKPKPVVLRQTLNGHFTQSTDSWLLSYTSV